MGGLTLAWHAGGRGLGARLWCGWLLIQIPASPQSSSRSSYYGPWGRSGTWASRRSSWNSLKHKPPSAEHESLLSGERGERGGSGVRACEGAREEGPPRAAPLHAPHAHYAHHGPHLAHRHRHHRRTLSLDTRDSVDLAELVPVVGAHSRAAWRAVGQAPGHEDCNGRMPNIAKDVFTKMDDRRDRGEDEEEIDYVSRAWQRAPEMLHHENKSKGLKEAHPMALGGPRHGEWGWRVGPELRTSDLPCHQSFLGWGLGREFGVLGWQSGKRWAALRSTNLNTQFLALSDALFPGPQDD